MDSIGFKQAKSIIYSYDFEQILVRLVKVEGWSKSDAIKAIEQYRNYLFLRKKYPECVLPPSRDIDEVWHAHILHSERYCGFCDDVFGFYLHHHPQQPRSRYQENSQSAQDLFESNTQRLHYQEFGEYIFAVKTLPFKFRLKRFCRGLKLKAFSVKAV